MSETIANLHGWMHQVLNTRRFRPDPVPVEARAALLEAFRLGPSSANVQPWELVTVASAGRRAAVAGATLDPFLSPGSEGAQAWVTEVPLLLAVCLDRPRAQARLGEHGWSQSVQDAFAAVQNLRLAAVGLGLATTLVREFQPARLAAALGLPFTVEPLALVAAGYPATAPEYPPRLELRHILHEDGWEQP